MIKHIDLYRTKDGLLYDCQFIPDANLAQAVGPLPPPGQAGARGMAFEVEANSAEEARQKLAEVIGPGNYLEMITTPTSGVSITASGIDETEREFIYPETIDSKEMVASTSLDLGIEIQPTETNKIVETLDIAKTYVSEVEFGITLQKGFKIKIKREPKKIIKSFKSE